MEGITIYKETNDIDISRVLAHYRYFKLATFSALCHVSHFKIYVDRREGFVREVAWDWSRPLPALLDYHGQKLLLQDCLFRFEFHCLSLFEHLKGRLRLFVGLCPCACLTNSALGCNLNGEGRSFAIQLSPPLGQSPG